MRPVTILKTTIPLAFKMVFLNSVYIVIAAAAFGTSPKDAYPGTVVDRYP